MTLLAFAEQIERAMRRTADEVKVDKDHHKVTCTAITESRPSE